MTVGQRPKKSGRRRPKRSIHLNALTLDRTLGRTLFGLALGGMAISAYLTHVHYRLLREPEWKSACQISTTFSCGSVLLSPYGSIAGVPLALLALCFYSSAAVIAWNGMRVGRRGRPRSPAAVLFCMSVLSALLSLALAMVSAVVFGAFCAFCSVLYAINLSMLGVGWYSVRGYAEGLREALLKERRYWTQHPNRGWITFALTSVGALAVTIGSRIHWHEPHPSFCEVVAQVQRSGPLELVIYSDFQCSDCRELSRSLRSFRETRRLQIVRRHYPLDSACNSSAKSSPHPNACMQAVAAICAGVQGREDEFSDRLFDRGEKDRAELATLAESLGLDGDRFTSCLMGGEGSRKLETIIATGHANGVKVTPTLFVNGRKHVGRLSEEDLVCLQNALRD